MWPSVAEQSFLLSVAVKDILCIMHVQCLWTLYQQQLCTGMRDIMTQRENRQARYLFFHQAVVGQLFLYSITCVHHQAGVCRTEGSQARRRAVILLMWRHKHMDRAMVRRSNTA